LATECTLRSRASGWDLKHRRIAVVLLCASSPDPNVP